MNQLDGSDDRSDIDGSDRWISRQKLLISEHLFKSYWRRKFPTSKAEFLGFFKFP